MYDCVGAGDDEKVCGHIGGVFGVDHDGDDAAADNDFAAAAVDECVTVSAAASAVDAAAVTHRRMRCRLWSPRDNAFRFWVSTVGCGVWG